jgi:hypothetical protein
MAVFVLRLLANKISPEVFIEKRDVGLVLLKVFHFFCAD